MFDVCCKKIKSSANSSSSKKWGIYSVSFYKDVTVNRPTDNTGNFKKEVVPTLITTAYISAYFKPTTWENGVEYQDRPKVNIKVQEMFLETNGIKFNTQSDGIYFTVDFGGSLGIITVQKGKFQFVSREGSVAEWSGAVKNTL